MTTPPRIALAPWNRDMSVAFARVSTCIVNMPVNLSVWKIPGSIGRIPLHFSPGRAFRRVVLPRRTVPVLEERRNALTLQAFALLPALLLVDRCLRIQNSLTELPARLFIGGLAYLVCIGLAVELLPSDIGLSVLNRARRTLRASWELS